METQVSEIVNEVPVAIQKAKCKFRRSVLPWPRLITHITKRRQSQIQLAPAFFFEFFKRCKYYSVVYALLETFLKSRNVRSVPMNTVIEIHRIENNETQGATLFVSREESANVFFFLRYQSSCKIPYFPTV